MQFLYSHEASVETLVLEQDAFKHLKAQRKKVGESVSLRNLEDEFIYEYEISQIQRNKAYLSLVNKKKLIKPSFDFHLGWSLIEPKNIEKTLPFLNEIGVRSISFIDSDFSQKNFKLDFKRMNRILTSSCEQCGRSDLMSFEVLNSIQEYLKLYPNSYVLDFGGKNIEEAGDVKQVLVGCEGGFSQKERELFKNTIAFQTPLILRSESAVVSIASKILL